LVAAVVAVMSCLVAQLINRVLQAAPAVVVLIKLVLVGRQLLVKEMLARQVVRVLVLLVAAAVLGRLVEHILERLVVMAVRVLHQALLELLLHTLEAVLAARTAMLEE
jgi:hypothetical protein